MATPFFAPISPTLSLQELRAMCEQLATTLLEVTERFDARISSLEKAAASDSSVRADTALSAAAKTMGRHRVQAGRKATGVARYIPGNPTGHYEIKFVAIDGRRPTIHLDPEPDSPQYKARALELAASNAKKSKSENLDGVAWGMGLPRKTSARNSRTRFIFTTPDGTSIPWSLHRRGDEQLIVQFKDERARRKWQETRVPRKFRTEREGERYARAWLDEREKRGPVSRNSRILFLDYDDTLAVANGANFLVMQGALLDAAIRRSSASDLMKEELISGPVQRRVAWLCRQLAETVPREFLMKCTRCRCICDEREDKCAFCGSDDEVETLP